MIIISHWQHPFNVSNLTFQTNDLLKSWGNNLSLKTYERREYLGFKWKNKVKSETVGVYFLGNTPQYIHRQLMEKPNFHWLVKIEDWVLLEYQKFENAQKKGVEKAQKAHFKKLFEVKMQKKEHFHSLMADSWLNRSKHNFHVWRESFQPIEVEQDKLLTLMDKKMLS